MSELAKQSGLWVLTIVMYKTVKCYNNNKLKLLFEFAGNTIK
jgi:hypothetical protein